MATFWTQPGYKGVYIYFSIIIVLVVSYTMCLLLFYGTSGISNNDILNYTFIEDMPVMGNFGGWSLSHVITFFIAGLLFPEQWILIFILGVIWEFLEVLWGELLVDFMGESNHIGNKKLLYSDKWITGNLTDIWANSIGLFLGYWTAMFLKERQESRYKNKYLS